MHFDPDGPAMKQGTRRPSWVRGQVLVEFALLLPIMLLLVLGIIEFGRAFMVRQVLTNTAREGARVGVIPGSTVGEVQTAMTNYLADAGLDGATTMAVNGVGEGATAGTQTQVTLRYNYQVFTGSFIPGWTGVIPLTHRTTMRHE
jgi:Flp pilus assembly protein TadG